ncbi:MAG: hypothetical protein ABJE63_04600 [Lentilitoribacter sp.]
MNKQIISGGGQMAPKGQMHGVPGTALFRSPDLERPHYMQHSALVPFPKGTIRNFKLLVNPDFNPTSGKFTAEIHRTDENGNGFGGTTGTGLLVATKQAGSFENRIVEIDICDNYRVSIKVDNDFVGPSIIAFTYSFEFEQS